MIRRLRLREDPALPRPTGERAREALRACRDNYNCGIRSLFHFGMGIDLYNFDIPTTPQAMRGPAFPAGLLFSSSGPA